MKSKVSKLFQSQTTILLNYVLIKLITFFMNPKENPLYLYDTIIPIKSLSKKDLAKMGKSIPRLLKYELWVEYSESRLKFILKNEPLSDIVIYNAKLLKNPPNIKMIKALVNILVSNYRPLPTKVDKEFSSLSKKYFYYLNYYQVQRQWNSGTIRKEKTKNDVQKLTQKELEPLYDDFIDEISKLQLKYRSFAKLIIDIYQTNSEIKYLSTDKSYEIIANFSKDYGISMFITCFHENHHFHEIIELSEFYPANSFSVTQLTNIIISCIKPELAKLYD